MNKLTITILQDLSIGSNHYKKDQTVDLFVQSAQNLISLGFAKLTPKAKDDAKSIGEAGPESKA